MVEVLDKKTIEDVMGMPPALPELAGIKIVGPDLTTAVTPEMLYKPSKTDVPGANYTIRATLAAGCYGAWCNCYVMPGN